MGKPRRKYSREFKVEAVKQVVEKGRSVAEVAEGLGVNPNMQSRRLHQLEHRMQQARGDVSGSPQ